MNNENNKLNALILSVGGTYEPLVTCVKEFKPDFIYFLHSEGTLKIAKEVIERTAFNGNTKFKELYNPESLEESFYKSRLIIQELKHENFNVFMDFTGGTKPMVAGLVLAAVGENIEYSYVGTSSKEGRDKNGLGIVKDGFEQVKKQKDPFDLYAVIEFNRGKEFFNKYQFQAARKNFQQAQSKLDEPYLKKISQLYLKIVNIYDSWDKFNIELTNEDNSTIYLSKAFNNILKLINEDETILNTFQKDNERFLTQLEDNRIFLENKISTKNKPNKNNIYFYLPDLLNNAYRRIEEGKYDDAVARLYRIMELVAQLKLNTLGIVDENSIKNFKFDINKIAFKDFTPDNYEAILDKLNINNFDHPKPTFTLSMYNDFNMLRYLNDDLGLHYIKDGKVKRELEKRNSSVLAHGLRPVNEINALKLYDYSLEYARILCPNIDKYIKMSQFPKFII